MRRFITLEQAISQSTEAEELKAMIESATAKMGGQGMQQQRPPYR
jgi:hypothetical protein